MQLDSSLMANFDNYSSCANGFGEYYETPPITKYDVVPFDRDSVAYSTYEFEETKSLFNTHDYGTSDSVPDQSFVRCSAYKSYDEPDFFTQSRINYSNFSFSEPKFIQYDPPPGDSAYFSYETKYTVSYSESGFNGPDFKEYDPTPYGGGYDPSVTYGKPLPPSDEICYPRSKPDSDGLSLEGFSYGTVNFPGDKDDKKPSTETKTTSTKEEEKQPGDGGEDVNLAKAMDSSQGEEEGGGGRGLCGDDHQPKPDYDYGYNCGSEERQAPQYDPYGYGLEAMDLCEGLFGYWPCLHRKDRRMNGEAEAAEVEGQESYSNKLWEVTAAEYLFGSPYGNGEQRSEIGLYYPGDCLYGWERNP